MRALAGSRLCLKVCRSPGRSRNYFWANNVVNDPKTHPDVNNSSLYPVLLSRYVDLTLILVLVVPCVSALPRARRMARGWMVGGGLNAIASLPHDRTSTGVDPSNRSD